MNVKNGWILKMNEKWIVDEKSIKDDKLYLDDFLLIDKN